MLSLAPRRPRPGTIRRVNDKPRPRACWAAGQGPGGKFLFSKRFSLLSARKSPCSAAKRDLPEDLERACLETVKARWFARLRDPLVKGEQIQGIASADYLAPFTGAGDPGLPPSVVGLLQRYRLPII
jgi:hypothetical protein